MSSPQAHRQEQERKRVKELEKQRFIVGDVWAFTDETFSDEETVQRKIISVDYETKTIVVGV